MQHHIVTVLDVFCTGANFHGTLTDVLCTVQMFMEHLDRCSWDRNSGDSGAWCMVLSLSSSGRNDTETYVPARKGQSQHPAPCDGLDPKIIAITGSRLPDILRDA